MAESKELSAETKRQSRAGATSGLLSALVPVVRRVAARYEQDEDCTNDLIQECLVHLASNLPKCRKKESLDAWAWKVADNLCRSMIRAEAARNLVSTDRCAEIPDGAPLPDVECEQACRNAAIRTAVRKLPERTRMAIELVYFEGLRHSEAAEQMDVSQEAVHRGVRRGLRELRHMQGLAGWADPADRRPTRRGRAHRPRGEHPVLVLHPRNEARNRVQSAVLLGETDRLLDGVRFARRWRELAELADALPGCPVVADPDFPGSRRSGMEELHSLHARLPDCPLIAYGDPHGPWQPRVAAAGIRFAAILRGGVDDDPGAVRLALLRAADCQETEVLLERIQKHLPPDLHRILDIVLHGVSARCTVAEVAGTLGISERTVERRCRAHGLPTPKALLSLATIFHVERLARWSGLSPGRTAVALGLTEACKYSRLVKRALGVTPSEVARHGGVDYVAEVMLQKTRCA